MILFPISYRLSQYPITRAKIADKFTHRAAAAVAATASTRTRVTFLSLLPSSWKKDSVRNPQKSPQCYLAYHSQIVHALITD